MAQQLLVPTAKPNDLNLILRPTQWKERTNFPKFSFGLHMCALSSACPPPTEQSVAYKIPFIHTKRKIYQCRKDKFIDKL